MTHPIQPGFAFTSAKYFKRTVNSYGIAHIYEYVCDHPEADKTIAIPDGSIDILFDESSLIPHCFAAGTVLKASLISNESGHKYFGVRFQPGILPSFIDGKPEDFVCNMIDLSLCCHTGFPYEQFACMNGFSEKADFFLKWYISNMPYYTKGFSISASDTNGKNLLVNTVLNYIETSSGLLKINEIEEYTGYSSRYINRIFKNYTGISPKTFSKIIQFQNTIDHFDHNASISISELAADHGYFDQPQFDHDFKKFTSYTPHQYKKILQKIDYASKFVIE